MLDSKSSRRQFLAASGAVALKNLIDGGPAPAQTTAATVSKHFGFANGSARMLPFYTDYGLATEGFHFLAEVRDLPPGIRIPGSIRRAYYIQGDNHSDDLKPVSA